MELFSPDFDNSQYYPDEFTCLAQQPRRPTLQWSGVLEEANSLALLMFDATTQHLHWLITNIPPTLTMIGPDDYVGTPGYNFLGYLQYQPPCPPPIDQEHKYIFRLFALNDVLPPVFACRENFLEWLPSTYLEHVDMPVYFWIPFLEEDDDYDP